jgi:hypothetical protein
MRRNPVEDCIDRYGRVDFVQWSKIQFRATVLQCAASVVFAVASILLIGVVLRQTGTCFHGTMATIADGLFTSACVAGEVWPIQDGLVVLVMLGAGLTAATIGRHLSTAPSYVDGRVEAILTKLEAETGPQPEPEEKPSDKVARIVEQAA